MLRAEQTGIPVAERVGFEPTEGCPSHAFQACRFGRSRTSPDEPPTLSAGSLGAVESSAGPRRVRWRSGPVRRAPVNQVRPGREQPSAASFVRRRSPGRHLTRHGVVVSGRQCHLSRGRGAGRQWARCPNDRLGSPHRPAAIRRGCSSRTAHIWRPVHEWAAHPADTGRGPGHRLR